MSWTWMTERAFWQTHRALIATIAAGLVGDLMRVKAPQKLDAADVSGVVDLAGMVANEIVSRGEPI